MHLSLHLSESCGNDSNIIFKSAVIVFFSEPCPKMLKKCLNFNETIFQMHISLLFRKVAAMILTNLR